MKQSNELEKNEENTQTLEVDWVAKLNTHLKEMGAIGFHCTPNYKNNPSTQAIAKDCCTMIEASKNGNFKDVTNEEM